MGIGRFLALCKREDENIEDNRGKVCLANGEKFQIEFTQGLKVRDVCIKIAKSLEITPVALDFFTLMTTDCEHCLKPNKQARQGCAKDSDHYLNPKRLLHADECASKVFFFRLAFKAIAGPDIKNVDKEAFSYFVMQCRWDYLNGRLTGLTKKDYLTLLILESIIRGHENNVSGKEVLDNPKKFGLQHMFIDNEFSVREIKNHLKKQITRFKTSQESVEKAKNHFLVVLEGVEDFGITKVTVSKFYVNSNSNNDDVHQVEWEILICPSGLKKRRTYKDEGDFDTSERGQPSGPKDEIISDYKDIEYLEVKQSESTEIIHISRMRGFLEVISVGKSITKKESLITLIEGFYRLLVNQYKELTKYQPGHELPLLRTQQKELEIHGPIERKKAETLLKAVPCPGGNKSGVHLIRRSRSRFDRYNLSFICDDEIKHYEVVNTESQEYGIDKGPKFKSLLQMLEYYKTPQRGIPTALKKYCPIPCNGLCALFDEQIVLEPPHPPTSAPPINEEYQFVQIGNMELQKLNHTFENGNYGERVFKARWLRADDEGYQEVFCRKLAPSLRSPEFKEKVVTASTKMSNLVHRNLVPLLCVCFFNEQNTYLAFEWIPSGTLDDYVLKKGDVTVETLITFAAQISEACMYLHQNNFVHGWLAAHNVLVVSDVQVKVSDVSVPCLREEGFLPVTDEVNRSPWKARECFLGRPYSKESDVWAFGVVLWEMFTKTKPFKNMDDATIIEVFQRGRHLASPKCCPEDVCRIMKSCWNLREPSHRPSFAQIVAKLRSISASLSPEEKQRKIPSKIDEKFTLEPLTMTSKSMPVSRVDGQAPCSSTSFDGPSSRSTADDLPTRDTTATSYPCSSADSDELDFIPQRDIQEIVWSPEEIELKIMEQKPTRAIPREGHEGATYDRISQVLADSLLETGGNTSHVSNWELLPEDDAVSETISEGDLERNLSKNGQVLENQASLKYISTNENEVPESDVKPSYSSINELNHVGFLACQFGSATPVECEADEREILPEDEPAEVDEPDQETTTNFDISDMTSRLDPFATDSDKSAALMFSSLGQSKPDHSVPTKQAASTVQDNLHPYGYIKPPVPSVPKVSAVGTNVAGSSRVKLPGPDIDTGQDTSASNTGGLIFFSKLDPFAISGNNTSPTDTSPLLDNIQGRKTTQRSSPSISTGSRKQSDFDSRRLLLTSYEAEKDLEHLTTSGTNFSSFLERDPFAEILSDDSHGTASNSGVKTTSTLDTVQSTRTRGIEFAKTVPARTLPPNSKLVRPGSTNSAGYVEVSGKFKGRPSTSSRGYVPDSVINSDGSVGKQELKKKVGMSRGQVNDVPGLLCYSQRDPFSDIAAQSGGNDASNHGVTPCTTHAQRVPTKSTNVGYRPVPGSTPRSEPRTSSGYKKAPASKVVSDRKHEESKGGKNTPAYSIDDSEIGSLSNRDVFSDILQNSTFTSNALATTSSQDTSSSKTTPEFTIKNPYLKPSVLNNGRTVKTNSDTNYNKLMGNNSAKLSGTNYGVAQKRPALNSDSRIKGKPFGKSDYAKLEGKRNTPHEGNEILSHDHIISHNHSDFNYGERMDHLTGENVDTKSGAIDGGSYNKLEDNTLEQLSDDTNELWHHQTSKSESDITNEGSDPVSYSKLMDSVLCQDTNENLETNGDSNYNTLAHGLPSEHTSPYTQDLTSDSSTPTKTKATAHTNYNKLVDKLPSESEDFDTDTIAKENPYQQHVALNNHQSAKSKASGDREIFDEIPCKDSDNLFIEDSYHQGVTDNNSKRAPQTGFSSYSKLVDEIPCKESDTTVENGITSRIKKSKATSYDTLTGDTPCKDTSKNSTTVENPYHVTPSIRKPMKTKANGISGYNILEGSSARNSTTYSGISQHDPPCNIKASRNTGYSKLLGNVVSDTSSDSYNEENISDEDPNDLVPSIELITKKGRTKVPNSPQVPDKDTGTPHVSRYLDLCFEHMDPFRDMSTVHTSITAKKPYSEPIFSLDNASSLQSSENDEPVRNLDSGTVQESEDFSSFGMRDPFAELIPSEDFTSDKELPSDGLSSVLKINGFQQNGTSDIGHSDFSHAQKGSVKSPYFGLQRELPVRNEKPQGVPRGSNIDTDDPRGARHDSPDNEPRGHFQRRDRDRSPPGKDPGGGARPPGGGGGKPPVSRKTSDIASAYAKVSIKTAETATGQVISSEVVVAGGEGGEIVSDEGGDEVVTGATAADVENGVEAVEDTVQVDPFNITAAEQSIQNLDPYRYEKNRSGRRVEVFEESMKSHIIPFASMAFNENERVLGKGAFGVVRRAKLTRVAQHKTRPSVDVAVKCLIEGATEIYKNSFKQEAINLMKLDNKFIVRFLGISYDEEKKLLLVTELVPQGSLDNYLKDPKNLKILGNEVLLQFSIQITMGMQYLESKKLVHRDLAARNILVATESHVKISDFGLSRIYDDDYYRSRRENQKLPIKWLAPECLEQKKFTVNSDVWSLGVTLWEMFSYGELPYNDVSFRNAQELIDHLKTGNRLKRPKACLEEIFTHIRECWHLEPVRRISFFLLKTFLEQVLDDKYQRKPYFM